MLRRRPSCVTQEHCDLSSEAAWYPQKEQTFHEKFYPPYIWKDSDLKYHVQSGFFLPCIFNEWGKVLTKP